MVNFSNFAAFFVCLFVFLSTFNSDSNFNPKFVWESMFLRQDPYRPLITTGVRKTLTTSVIKYLGILDILVLKQLGLSSFFKSLSFRNCLNKYLVGFLCFVLFCFNLFLFFCLFCFLFFVFSYKLMAVACSSGW